MLSSYFIYCYVIFSTGDDDDDDIDDTLQLIIQDIGAAFKQK